MKKILIFTLFFLLTGFFVFAQAPTKPKIGELPIGKVLTWHTEGDYEQLFVQRSNDGVYYTTIGKVKPQDTIEQNYYTFLDASLAPEEVYYRIAQASHKNGIQYSEATFYCSAAPNIMALKRISNTHVDKLVIVEFESAENGEGKYLISTKIQNQSFTVLERPFPVFVGKNVLPIKVELLDPGFYQVDMVLNQEHEKFSFVKEPSKKPGDVIVVKK